MNLNIKALSKVLKNPIYLLLFLGVLYSHDLYIKMETYFLKPNQKATLNLYNGTFDSSENTIALDRISDASFVSQGKRIAIESNQWKDQDSTITQVNFNTGKAGTYVAGISTKARSIKLEANEFNDYLKHDGVLDILKHRTDNNLLDQDAIESYQKHVKAIYQVGNTKTNDWNTILGYPIEFVPLANPYEKYSGEKLAVKLLVDGKPLPNQLVFADYVPTGHSHDDHDHKHGENDHNKDDHHHTHKSDSTEGHTHTNGQQLRTDEQGVITVDLPKDGIYYLRTIYMVNVTDNDEFTHESKWATLTFEVTHKHDATTHTHDHDHEEGIPTWAFILGSILIIGVFFLIFRKKD